MNQNHFQTQLNRLAETFGGQYYKRERVELIWSEVASLPDELFTKIVSRFIGESRTAPLVPEFREEASKERERLWQIQKKNRPNVVEIGAGTRCRQCRDLGYLVARHKSEMGIFAFKCLCDAGKACRNNFPSWAEASGDFEVCA